ncbi:hypothetical protein B0H17DRAFT_661614 [Mycena rosella]|uniref:Uncharacterized protein n=1 Tax=Mycena rosella TaxID=1033263 RepID=A0AAD7DCP9_MYCRO|nr:hypothetical protein B0H17DRAFT_661614 [Mycena rosella]
MTISLSGALSSKLSRHRPTMVWSSPPAESLPPPMFFDTVVMDNSSRASNARWQDALARADPSWGSLEEEAILPRQRIKYFNATVVPSYTEASPWVSSISTECPRWSEWAASQFTFDYLFTLITSSTTPELFKERYREQYLDAVFKLSLIIDSIGKMPDGSPPPSFFQSFYFLRRLFPNGFLPAGDFTGEVGTTIIVKFFALGIAVANQAICEQRNLNLDWEDMCDIPDSHVDALEMTALAALNGDVFDLSENRAMYLDWLGHLGYHAEYHHCRTAQTYLRSSADLFAFTQARASFLPRAYPRSHVQPIHIPFVENLSFLLCWGTGVAPLRLETIQSNCSTPRSIACRTPSPVFPPTASDLLAALAEEYTSRLLSPLSVRAARSLSW